MKYKTYTNTATHSDLHWAHPVHTEFDLGYAYETDTHFVHFYGSSQTIWPISPGMCVTQGKAGVFADWLVRNFSATSVVESLRDVGETVSTVWRPGIEDYDDIRAGLGTTDFERHQALQTIRLLLERLDDIFVYMEPTLHSLQAHSHKTRELLILAATEAENSWARYLRTATAAPANGNFYTTNDYVRLLQPLFLAEYQLTLRSYPTVPPLRPFANWTAQQPTQSLNWYHAYNQTKHDRDTHFDKATLKNAIDAVAANLVLFSVRFSPYPLWREGGPAASLYNELFTTITLVNPDPRTFYVPLITYPANPNLALRVFSAKEARLIQPWNVQPFTL